MNYKFFLFAIFLSLINLTYAKNHQLIKEIKKMTSWLEASSVYKRNLATNKLIRIGDPIIPYLKKEFVGSNYLKRRQIITICGKIGSKKAIKLLFMALNDNDEGVRNRVTLAFLELSDYKPDLVLELKTFRSSSIREQSALSQLRETLTFKRIEEELAKLVTSSGNIDYNPEQFISIYKLGKKAIRPLLAIFYEENYQFIYADFSDNQQIGYRIRLLAGQALGEFDSIIVRTQRAIVMAKLRELRSDTDPEIRRTVACTLAKLNDREFWQRIVKEYKSQVKDHPENSLIKFHLAMMYLRIGRNFQARRLLQKTVEQNADDSLAHYYLACTYASRKNKSKSIKSLKMAIAKGFRDFECIQYNPSLKCLYTHPKFRLLASRWQIELKPRARLGVLDRYQDQRKSMGGF